MIHIRLKKIESKFAGPLPGEDDENREWIKQRHALRNPPGVKRCERE